MLSPLILLVWLAFGFAKILDSNHVFSCMSHLIREELTLVIQPKTNKFIYPIQRVMADRLVYFFALGEPELGQSYPLIPNYKDEESATIKMEFKFPSLAKVTVRLLFVYRDLPRPKSDLVLQGQKHYWQLEKFPVHLPAGSPETKVVIFAPPNDLALKFYNLDGNSIDQKYATEGSSVTFTASKDLLVSVFYELSMPKIVFTSWSREVYPSQWTKKMIINDKFTVLNDSPRIRDPNNPLFIKDGFSRCDFGHSYYHQDKAFPMSQLRLGLPKELSFVSVRDEVGNISTTNYQWDSGILDIKPRFPLFGGWQSSFELSYEVPLSNEVPLLESLGYGDFLITDYRFDLVFPQFSQQIQVDSPLVGSDHMSIHAPLFLDWTFPLDVPEFKGRPQYTFVGKHLIKEHLVHPSQNRPLVFSAVYDLPLWAFLLKPLWLIMWVWFLFLGYYFWRKIATKVE